MTAPELSVSIVSNNNANYLGACLDSLLAERQKLSMEVWVVDNASTDGTARLVAEKYAWARVIRQEQRQGFSANNNAAVRQSSGRYILILNPDTVVRPGALERAVAFMDTHPRVGVCGLRLMFPDGRVQPSCRRFPTLTSVIVRRTPGRVFLRESPQNARHLMLDFDHNQSGAVDWLLGACLFVRREFLHDVGLLDAGFMLYAEDIDWCYRAHRAGWEVWYCADAIVIHYHQAKSDRRMISRASWIHLQSMWRYYRKHLAPKWLRLNVDEERLPISANVEASGSLPKATDTFGGTTAR
jgi:N-acetylglucosaminyl-diphospho-decaprenol L-rhamnosyltransferase